MKIITARSQMLALGAAALLLLAGCTGAPESGQPVALEDDMAKGSYGIGYRVTENLKREFGDSLNEEAMIQGVRDSLAGAEERISEQEFMAGLDALGSHMEANQAAAAAENLVLSQAFHQENGQRPEVVTTASGLQYEILVEADGPKPTSQDEVVVHYEGRLQQTGEVFDSSRSRGQEVTFPLRGLIPGWVEALQLMPVGSSWRLYIPPQLAYGEQGGGALIGPNQTLIFDVELLGIVSDDGQD